MRYYSASELIRLLCGHEGRISGLASLGPDSEREIGRTSSSDPLFENLTFRVAPYLDVIVSVPGFYDPNWIAVMKEISGFEVAAWNKWWAGLMDRGHPLDGTKEGSVEIAPFVTTVADSFSLTTDDGATLWGFHRPQLSWPRQKMQPVDRQTLEVFYSTFLDQLREYWPREFGDFVRRDLDDVEPMFLCDGFQIVPQSWRYLHQDLSKLQIGRPARATFDPSGKLRRIDVTKPERRSAGLQLGGPHDSTR